MASNPPRIPGGYGQATLVHTIDGDPEPMVITIGLGDDIPDAAAAQTMCNSVHGAWEAQFMINMPDQLTIQRTDFDYHLNGEADDDPFHSVTYVHATAGANVDPSVPQNTAILVHKTTDLAGRSGRGRMYVPCVAESEVDNVGALSAGYLAVLNGNVESFRTAYEGVVVGSHFYLFHSIPVGALIAPNPSEITGLYVDPRVATQRRRLRH